MDLVSLSYKVASTSLGWGILTHMNGRLATLSSLSRSSFMHVAEKRSEQDIKSEQDFAFKNVVRRYLDQIAKIYSHSLLAILQEKDRSYSSGDIFIFAEMSSSLRKRYPDGVELDEDTVSISGFPIPELIPVLEALSVTDQDLRSAASRLPREGDSRILRDENLAEFLVPFRNNMNVEAAEELVSMGRECPLFTVDSSQISRAIFSQAKGEDVAKLNDALQKTITRLVSRVPQHVVKATHDLFSPSLSTSVKEGADKNEVMESLIRHLKMRRRVGVEFDFADLYTIIQYADAFKKFWDDCIAYSENKSGDRIQDKFGFKTFCASYYPSVNKLLQEGRNANVSLFSLPEFLDALREYYDNLDSEELAQPSNEFISKNIKSIFRDYRSIPYLSGVSDDVKSIKAITDLFQTRILPGGFSSDFLSYAKSTPGSSFVETGSIVKKQLGKSKSLVIPRSPKPDDSKGVSVTFFLPSGTTLGQKMLEISGLPSKDKMSPEQKQKFALLNEYKQNFAALLSSVHVFKDEDGEISDIKTARNNLREVVKGLLEDKDLENYLKYSLNASKLADLVGSSLDKISTNETLASRYNQVRSVLNLMDHEWQSDPTSLVAISHYIHKGNEKIDPSIVQNRVIKAIEGARQKLDSNFKTLGKFETGNKTNERVVHVSFKSEADYNEYLNKVGQAIKKALPDLDTSPSKVLDLLANLDIYCEDNLSKKSGNWVNRLEESGAAKERKDKIRVPTSARQFVLQELSAEFMHTLINNERITRQTLDEGVQKSVSTKIADNFIRSMLSLILKMIVDLLGGDKESASEEYASIGKDLTELRKSEKYDDIITGLKDSWSGMGLSNAILDKILKFEDVVNDDDFLDLVKKSESKINSGLKSSLAKISKNDSYLFGTSLDSEKLEEAKNAINKIISSPSVSTTGINRSLRDSLALRRNAIREEFQRKNVASSKKLKLTYEEAKAILEPMIYASLGKILSSELSGIGNIQDLVQSTLKEHEQEIESYIRDCASLSDKSHKIKLSNLELDFVKDAKGGSVEEIRDLVNLLPKNSRIHDLFVEFKERIQKEHSDKLHGDDFKRLDTKSIEEEALGELQHFLKSADRNQEFKPRHMSGDIELDTEESGSHRFWDTINEDNPLFKGEKEPERSKEYLGMSGLFEMFQSTDDLEERKLLTDANRVLSMVQDSPDFKEPKTEAQLNDKKKLNEFMNWMGSSGQTLRSYEHEGIINVSRYLSGNSLITPVNLSKIKDALYKYFILKDVDKKLSDKDSSDYNKMMDLSVYASGDLESSVSAQSDAILKSISDTSTSFESDRNRLESARKAVSSILKERISRILRQNAQDEHLDESSEVLHHVFRISNLAQCFIDIYESVSDIKVRVFDTALSKLSKIIPGRVRLELWGKCTDSQRTALVESLNDLEKTGKCSLDSSLVEALDEIYFDVQILYKSYRESADKSGRLGFKLPDNYKRINYIERLLKNVHSYLESGVKKDLGPSTYEPPQNELAFETELYKKELDNLKSDPILVVASFAQEMAKKNISIKYRELYSDVMGHVKKKYSAALRDLELVTIDDVYDLIINVNSRMSLESPSILPQFNLGESGLKDLKNAVLSTKGWKEEWSEDSALNIRLMSPLAGMNTQDPGLNTLKTLYTAINPDVKFTGWRAEKVTFDVGEESGSKLDRLPNLILSPLNVSSMDYMLEYWLNKSEQDMLQDSKTVGVFNDYKKEMLEFKQDGGYRTFESFVKWIKFLGVGSTLTDLLDAEAMLLLKNIPTEEKSLLELAEKMLGE